MQPRKVQNKVRIIGGEWRRRQLSVGDTPGLRPTPARVRETIFNWLQYDVVGSRCLDLFAGSGALGVEAASRGAEYVVQVESNALVCRSLKATTFTLQTKKIKIVQQDVLRFLAGDAEPFDLVFLDPPFAQNLAVQSCQWLEDKGWLAETSKIYVEVEKGLSIQGLPQNWQLLKQKQAGEVSYHLFHRSGKITSF